MKRVRDTLAAYDTHWPAGKIPYQGFNAQLERSASRQIVDFVQKHDASALQRTCAEGHLTASALVINPDFDRVLLMLHAKLGKWLQLGGHVDGDEDLAASALREAREESGREDVALFRWEKYLLGEEDFQPMAFDCDVHEIPARKAEPAHFHFDLRYLCVLADSLEIVRNEEAHDLRWLTLNEARELTNEPSMLRQFAKLEAIKAAVIRSGALRSKAVAS